MFVRLGGGFVLRGRLCGEDGAGADDPERPGPGCWRAAECRTARGTSVHGGVCALLHRGTVRATGDGVSARDRRHRLAAPPDTGLGQERVRPGPLRLPPPARRRALRLAARAGPAGPGAPTRLALVRGKHADVGLLPRPAEQERLTSHDETGRTDCRADLELEPARRSHPRFSSRGLARP